MKHGFDLWWRILPFQLHSCVIECTISSNLGFYCIWIIHLLSTDSYENILHSNLYISGNDNLSIVNGLSRMTGTLLYKIFKCRVTFLCKLKSTTQTSNHFLHSFLFTLEFSPSNGHTTHSYYVRTMCRSHNYIFLYTHSKTLLK